ncbi:MAG: hypothetical protein KBF36_01415 [Chitinophagaceae bacterium]|jgi:hypothetical protein|nr:hypothetical protein [Chitinophagaceae bacterium]MBP9740027.1 hypothetical protein [Chitinophagaceae bacterium]
MKQFLKRSFSITDWLIIASNIFAIGGVWMLHWDAKIIFLIFCLETVIIGVFNFLQMWLTTLYKKTDTWQSSTNYSTQQSGYVFMFFFLFHYGFFVLVQLFIFLSIMSINGLKITVLDLLFKFNTLLPSYAVAFLGLFVATYILGIIKDFIMTGSYKTANLNELMFRPYKRIFVQQFVIILGTFVLMVEKEGKIFMLIFIPIKVFFEMFIDYDKVIKESINKVK